MSSGDLFSSSKGNPAVMSSMFLMVVLWPQGSTYNSVCDTYVRYVTQKYGTATVIVFDGYKEEQAIKDATQLRRTGVTPDVTVDFC